MPFLLDATLLTLGFTHALSWIFLLKSGANIAVPTDLCGGIRLACSGGLPGGADATHSVLPSSWIRKVAGTMSFPVTLMQPLVGDPA
jgi:hypothetical protein